MPRRYHRPPQAKKRKARKTRIPYVLEDADVVAEPENGGLPLAEEQEEEAPAAVAPVRVQRPSQDSEAAPPVPHIGRDYSYVKAEVVRILVIAGLLLLGLVITAILRH